ncbi:MAG: amidohydrolase family protein [Oscillospiraceae bacterium]|nr:amidohydrolase family protein [Oscillospiraceae bacterium]
MLIDFHVHVFPEKIAKQTFEVLENNIRRAYKLEPERCFSGTVDGLKELMAKTGVDLSVIMPIATKPTQYKSINKYAEEITDGKSIISFASVHPYQDNVEETLCDIVSSRFKGIKLHPDYQSVYADDEKFIALVKSATEKGLYVTTHAGQDVGVIPPYRSTAVHLRAMLKNVDSSRVILAHMGAFDEWDEAERLAKDFDAYFDISVVSSFIDKDQYRRIIDKRGVEKILFGSDAPWENPADTLKFLKASGISDEEFELITHKNAEKILFS